MQQKPVPPTANGELPHEEDPAADSYVHDASSQVPPKMHTHMNGSMPPQQVYVETNMGPPNGVAGLENQFQSLGIQSENGGMVNGHDNNHHPGNTATTADGENTELDEGDDIEGGEGEDDPLKLFVGQVRYGGLL